MLDMGTISITVFEKYHKRASLIPSRAIHGPGAAIVSFCTQASPQIYTVCRTCTMPTLLTIEVFAINHLAVSARSGRSKSEFNICLSVDIWYPKFQVHSKTGLSPLLVFIITLYISTTSKKSNSYLPDLAETAKFLIAKNQIDILALFAYVLRQMSCTDSGNCQKKYLSSCLKLTGYKHIFSFI